MSQTQRALERRRYLIDLIKKDEVVSVDEISNQYQVAKQTVYNDLRWLRGIGIDIESKRGYVGAKPNRRANLIREITFPPEYKEAGVSILSYFSRILEQKYPEKDVQVTIIQHGKDVKLKIESDEGEIETIEKTLSEYGQVVLGKISPEKLLPNSMEVVELKNRLEIARLELRLKENAFVDYQNNSNKRITSLEEQLSELRSIIGTQLTTVQSLADTIAKTVEAERLSPAVAKAINSIKDLISREHTKENEKELTKALKIIQKEDKKLLGRIISSISTTGHSIAANLATPWVISLLDSFPK